VYIATFGWFQVTAITGPNTNPTAVTLLNLGYAGNASTGTIGTAKVMQVSDIANLTSPMYNYTSQQLISACQTVINTIEQAFPNAVVTLACGRNGNLDPTSGGVLPVNANADYVCEQLASANFGKKQVAPFTIQKNQLNANTPTPPNASGTNFQILAEFQSSNLNAGQATWFCYNTDGSPDSTYRNNGGTPGDPRVILANMLSLAQQYGMHWFETYQSDIIYASDVVAAGKIKPH
jgi:hypothetical protein